MTLSARTVREGKTAIHALSRAVSHTTPLPKACSNTPEDRETGVSFLHFCWCFYTVGSDTAVVFMAKVGNSYQLTG